MSKKICIVTGSRADYGLLANLMYEIQSDDDLQLQIISTGMHHSPEFGLTYREIGKDGFTLDKQVEIPLDSDSSVGVTRSTGLAVIGIGEALEELVPDLLVVLGDRFEILAAATAALISNVPIAHLHGGEKTLGAFDESIRHAITKMANLHFVAAEEYRKRVIQMGENPDNVINVGGLGIDSILKIELLSRTELEKRLGLKFAQKSLLVTFHPVTLERASGASQVGELLTALAELKDTTLIFTFPNADPESGQIITQIEDFVKSHPDSYVYISLGQQLYFSCVDNVDGVIGNSSSGLLEVPSFQKGTVNIGDRQEGRLKADSVIDCAPGRSEILKAIGKLYSRSFQDSLETVENPYGKGGASRKIVEFIKNLDFPIQTKKYFYDLGTKNI